ncbi:PAS domain S-box protein [Methanosarcina hadiensis]|uniref:PAS domain S-box protein n=1 Tax=Methanosarcina hadiensis TaxID=3078083 RepID=UPI003977C0DF
MTSNLMNEEELEIRVQERTTELEKANQELRAWIIKHKRKEEELLQSKFRYQTLFNSIEEGFCVIEMIFDENGKPVDYRFLETNSAFEKQTGLIDAQGKRMRELTPEHEEYWYEIFGRIALTGQPARFQYHAKQLNRWYDVYAFRFGEPEKKHVAIIFNDITERKKTEEVLRLSEEKFSIAFANNPAAITLTRLEDGLFLDVNDTWVSLNGYNRDEAIGHSARKMNIWPTEEAVSRFVQELRKKGSLSGWEQEFHKKSGESYVAQLSAQVLTIGGEKVILSTLIDITERKLADEALRENETRFRTMFEAHGAPMLLIEPDSGQIIDANDAAARFYEYSREQLRAMRIDRINQLPPEEVAAERQKAVEHGKNVFIFRHRLASGSLRWVEVYSSPVTIQGKPILFSVIHDITERKWAEEALKEAHDSLEEKIRERTAELEKAYNLLKESEISLAEAQHMAHLGNWDWNIITNEMYWSDEIYRIFGLTPQEFGATYYGFLDYVHPEDRYYVNSAVKEALDGKTYSIDYRIIMASGEERTVHEQAEVIFDKKNNPVRMKGTVQDITERKQVEDELKRTGEELRKRNQEIISERQRLYNVLETLPVAIVLLKPDHHITFANRVFRDKFGNLDSRKCYDFCFGLTRPCEFCEAFKVLETEKPHHWEATMPDGRVLDVYDLPFRDVDGSLKVLEMDIDITERKKAEESLAKMEQVRIKEIHHRIKNNLQVISSLLDLQSEALSHHEVCKISDVVEAFAESQNRVISMALIHEELYKGDKIDTLDFAAYLRKLTEDLFSSYKPGNKDVSFSLDLEQVDLGMDIAIPLGIIVNELVSNSFKHAFPDEIEGKIQINLLKIKNSSSVSDIAGSDGDYIEKGVFDYILKVSDNGKGIPKEINFKNTNSLGLQLVGILVEQIDGCIKVKSDHGTEFTIWFNNLEI